uniref:Secreted protein n=1 Tax=Triticum urartu TaxID=4572 RepID=A0A8R7UDF0_TRIUA
MLILLLLIFLAIPVRLQPHRARARLVSISEDGVAQVATRPFDGATAVVREPSRQLIGVVGEAAGALTRWQIPRALHHCLHPLRIGEPLCALSDPLRPLASLHHEPMNQLKPCVAHTGSVQDVPCEYDSLVPMAMVSVVPSWVRGLFQLGRDGKVDLVNHREVSNREGGLVGVLDGAGVVDRANRPAVRTHLHDTFRGTDEAVLALRVGVASVAHEHAKDLVARRAECAVEEAAGVGGHGDGRQEPVEVHMVLASFGVVARS